MLPVYDIALGQLFDSFTQILRDKIAAGLCICAGWVLRIHNVCMKCAIVPVPQTNGKYSWSHRHNKPNHRYQPDFCG